MKIVVSGLACAVLLLGFVLAALNAPAHAETIYPFCKLGGGELGTGAGACYFSSFEQCRIASAGYGICQANPAYVAPAPVPAAPRRAKRG
jgi:Protein of unknown function (DUF3551)